MFINSVFTAFQPNEAGADDFQNVAVGRYGPHKSGYLVIIACDFKGQRRRLYVDGMRAKELSYLQEIQAVSIVRLDLDHSHTAADRGVGVQMMDGHDIRKFFQLLGDLIDEGIVACDDDSNAG